MTFPEAIFPGPMRVAGVRLHPMTIGHALILQRLGSPFAPSAVALGDEQPGSGDIVLLLWVCSQPWWRAWPRRMSAVSRLWRSWFAGRIRPALDHYRSLANAYVGHCWSGPKVRPSSDASPLVSPALGVVMVALMAEFGFSREEALDTPVAEALWMVGIQCERGGMVEMDSEEGVGLVDIARELARQEAGKPA